jgi:hypothetical protein
VLLLLLSIAGGMAFAKDEVELFSLIFLSRTFNHRLYYSAVVFAFVTLATVSKALILI